MTPIWIKPCGAINDVNNNSQIVTNNNQIFGQDGNTDSVVNFDVDISADQMKEMINRAKKFQQSY